MLRDIKMLFLQTTQILHSFEALNWKETTNSQALKEQNAGRPYLVLFFQKIRR